MLVNVRDVQSEILLLSALIDHPRGRGSGNLTPCQVPGVRTG